MYITAVGQDTVPVSGCIIPGGDGGGGIGDKWDVRIPGNAVQNRVRATGNDRVLNKQRARDIIICRYSFGRIDIQAIRIAHNNRVENRDG